MEKRKKGVIISSLTGPFFFSCRIRRSCIHKETERDQDFKQAHKVHEPFWFIYFLHLLSFWKCSRLNGMQWSRTLSWSAYGSVPCCYASRGKRTHVWGPGAVCSSSTSQYSNNEVRITEVLWGKASSPPAFVFILHPHKLLSIHWIRLPLSQSDLWIPTGAQ